MRDVDGYDGEYAVDEIGNVFSLKFGKCKKLKLVNHSEGYDTVNLCKNGKVKQHLVHRLIAQAYLEKYSEDLQVDHIDRNRQNNKLENLRIVTSQQNHFNITKVKGYYLNKKAKKWHAQIMLNRKHKHLGCFDTEQEARDAYLEAKKIFHVI